MLFYIESIIYEENKQQVKPRVSIIIPVYNKRNYISACLNALLSQKYEHYEIILIDDGSTDGSGELLDELAMEYNRIMIRVYHQKNQGVAVARNKGLELAEGEWVWFVDADDIPNNSWLNEIEKYLKDGKYDIIFSNYTKVFSDKNEVVVINIVGEISESELPQIFMNLQYKNGFFGYLWCKLLKRSFIEKNHIFFTPGLTLAEDLKFLVELYQNKPKTLFVKTNAYNYTVDAINSSKDKDIEYVDQLAIHYEIYLWIKDTACFSIYKSELIKHISYYIAFVFFYGFEKNGSIKEAVQWLEKNPHYQNCLEGKDLTGIMKLIVLLLKHGQYDFLSGMLRIRTLLRNIYRGIRRL